MTDDDGVNPYRADYCPEPKGECAWPECPCIPGDTQRPNDE